MTQPYEPPLHRTLFLCVAILLAVGFVAGGGTQARGWGETLLQLGALPVLVLMAGYALHAPGHSRLALCIALLVPIAVAMQLLPSPGWAEAANGPRRMLHEAVALAESGEGGFALRISLAPWATERGFWSLLPALAAFCAALLLDGQRKRQLSWCVVGLAVFSLVLGFLQLGTPQDSVLNPFPQWAPALGGVFANPNHQATALTLAMVVTLSWIFASWGRETSGRAVTGPVPVAWRRASASLLVLVLLIAIPLTGSRAMVLIAAAAALAAPLTSGWLRGRMRDRQRKLGLALLGTGAMAAAALAAAVSSWVRVDSQMEYRGSVARVTMDLAREAMPLGTGVGSFVPWFDAHAPKALMQFEYFNHAHNEYVQWWLESGLAGLAWGLVLLMVLVWAFPWKALQWRSVRSSRPRTGENAGEAVQGNDWIFGAAWLAVAVLLAHSAVDYPLRTPALMTAGAWFAGVMVSGALARSAVSGVLSR